MRNLWRAISALLIAAQLCLLGVSFPACSSAARREVIHVVDENCERLSLPEPVCVAVSELGPLLALLLAAQRDGVDAVVEVHEPAGARTVVVPHARIPGAIGEVSGAAARVAARAP